MKCIIEMHSVRRNLFNSPKAFQTAIFHLTLKTHDERNFHSAKNTPLKKCIDNQGPRINERTLRFCLCVFMFVKADNILKKWV